MSGRRFTLERRAGPADVAADGHAHLEAIARWLQDAAYSDGVDAGLGHSSGWIVRRIELELDQRPRFGEQLEIQTWCSGVAASVAERSSAIAGSDGAAVQARAIWVHIDIDSRRPARVTDEFLAVYGESAAGVRPRTSLRHPRQPPEDGEPQTWEFAAADLDFAGHVNNAVYWRLAEQYLPTGEDPVRLEAEYRAGIGAGPAKLQIGESMLWVAAPEGEIAGTLGVVSA